MSAEAGTTRFGILGTGRVAQLHADAMARLGTAELKSAWNRSTAAAEGFCQTYGCEMKQSADALLEDPEIDAVLVTTISGTHYEFARRAMLAGKHVMVEKPISATLEEIQDLEQVAQSAGVVCFPSHNYVYAEQMRSLRHHLDRGALGHPLNYWCLFNNRHPPDFGDPDVVMRELMIHHVYSMLHYMGRPSSLVATASNIHFSDPEAPDQIMITAVFPSGAVGNLWGSFACNDDRVREPWSVVFKLIGTEGAAQIAWDNIKCGPEPEPLWDDMAYRDSFMHAQRYFVEECLGRGKAPLSTLSDAEDALRVLDAAREAIATGRRVAISYRN